MVQAAGSPRHGQQRSLTCKGLGALAIRKHQQARQALAAGGQLPSLCTGGGAMAPSCVNRKILLHHAYMQYAHSADLHEQLQILGGPLAVARSQARRAQLHLRHELAGRPAGQAQ